MTGGVGCESTLEKSGFDASLPKTKKKLVKVAVYSDYDVGNLVKVIV